MNAAREMQNDYFSSGASSYGGSGSEAENSPSPEPDTGAGADEFDFASLDTAKLVDFGEEENSKPNMETIHENNEPFK
jgi:hypothetical protein